MSKRKIPRLALAALTLGACAGGDGDGQGNPAALDALSGGSQDVSQERVDAVVAAMCSQLNECVPEEFSESYTSVDECEDAAREFLEDEGDAACKDAMLDFYGCFTKLTCEAALGEDGAGCETLEARVDEKCDYDDSDYDSDDYDSDDYDPEDYDY